MRIGQSVQYLGKKEEGVEEKSRRVGVAVVGVVVLVLVLVLV